MIKTTEIYIKSACEEYLQSRLEAVQVEHMDLVRREEAQKWQLEQVVELYLKVEQETGQE